MKCQVCKIREAQNGSIVCSNTCNEIRLFILKLSQKYTPTHGCDNCWGDLGGMCTEKCQNEFQKSNEFIGELYSLIRLVINRQ